MCSTPPVMCWRKARASSSSRRRSAIRPARSKRAVMHGVQGSFVWLIGAGDKVEFRPVQLGTTAENEVVVDQGLKAGERIVVDGILKVQPGAVVKGVPLAAEAAPNAAPAQPAAPGKDEKAPS